MAMSFQTMLDKLRSYFPGDIHRVLATIANEANVLRADLASTDASKGASLIGVRDAGNLITATDAEGALAELAQFKTDLGLTTNGNGASRIGIADAGNLIAATTVEAALQELAVKTDTSPVTALSIAAGVVNIDLSLGNYFTLTLTANVTSITFTNAPAAGRGITYAVQITQGAGPYTVAWPASFKWEGGTPASVSTANGAVDVLAVTSFDQLTTQRATLAKAWA